MSVMRPICHQRRYSGLGVAIGVEESDLTSCTHAVWRPGLYRLQPAWRQSVLVIIGAFFNFLRLHLYTSLDILISSGTICGFIKTFLRHYTILVNISDDEHCYISSFINCMNMCHSLLLYIFNKQVQVLKEREYLCVYILSD